MLRLESIKGVELAEEPTECQKAFNFESRWAQRMMAFTMVLPWEWDFWAGRCARARELKRGRKKVFFVPSIGIAILSSSAPSGHSLGLTEDPGGVGRVFATLLMVNLFSK